jgi:hypothetical protein
VQKRECFSCHHQALPAMAVALARGHGFAVDTSAAREQSKYTRDFYHKRRDFLHKGAGVPGGPYNAGYALVALGTDGWPADETTEALGRYLFKTQTSEGRWRIISKRPPLEDSDFTATALALRGLLLYPPTEGAKEVPERVVRARRWLLKTPPRTNEEEAYRLLGLLWSGASVTERDEAAARLRTGQRADGGWGQLADMESDSYATGQALVALKLAGGLSVDHSSYRRGVKFLLRTRLDDGSWFVKSRSRPFQAYFESGFPHGKDQWISVCGTSWAVMALALSYPEALPNLTGTTPAASGIIDSPTHRGR